MVKFVSLNLSTFVLLLLHAPTVHAIDAADLSLITQSTKQKSAPSTSVSAAPDAAIADGNESPFYQIRPKASAATTAASTIRSPTTQKKSMKRKIASEAEDESYSPSGSLSDIANSEKVAGPSPKLPLEKKSANYGFSDQMQDILFGGTADEIRQYKESLDDRDIRKNAVELSVAPMLVYNDSNSSSWYRSYNAIAEGIGIDGTWWASPVLGIAGEYATTFSGTIRNSFTVPTQTSFVDTWTSGGLKFRRFLGPEIRPSIFTIGLMYSTFQFKVPENQTERLSYRTSGVQLKVDAMIPQGKNSWLTVGVFFSPRQTQEESSNANQIVSGTSQETNTLGASLGGEYMFNRGERFFYRVRGVLEKTLFSGAMPTNDPVAGSALNGVAVQNSFTFFELGYTWGK